MAAGAKAKSGPRRILIMYSNTGGGHKASAEAIKAAFAEKYGKMYKVCGGVKCNMQYSLCGGEVHHAVRCVCGGGG